jgi:cytochrome c biogenesis protein CcmG/thiol:disulfide interchange protein DsbE
MTDTPDVAPLHAGDVPTTTGGAPTTTGDLPTDDPGGPPAIGGLRRTRRALWIAVAVAVPLALLIGVLATRPPSATRAVRSPLVGKPAPPIESVTVDGHQAGLSEMRGRWVVVNFFATWCVPCRQEHPDLVRFSQEHEAAGDASVLGVVYSDNTQAVREFRDANGGTWPMLTDPKGRIALDYGVSGVPESFLVGPDGVVVAKLLGGVRADDLDQLLYRAKSGR